MEEVKLNEILEYFKSKSLIIAILIVVISVICIFLIFKFKTPLYESSTNILVVSRDEEIDNTQLQVNKSLIRPYGKIVESRLVVDEVIKNLDLKEKYNELIANIEVEEDDLSSTITITVKNEDSKKSMLIANELASVLKLKTNDIYKLDNVIILDAAYENKIPYNINYARDGIIIIFFVTMIIITIVFMGYYFDTSIKSADVIEDRFELTVLGMIPEIELDIKKSKEINLLKYNNIIDSIKKEF